MAIVIKNLRKESLKRGPFQSAARVPAYFYYNPDIKEYVFVLSSMGGFTAGRRFDILEVEDSELDEKDKELQLLRAENQSLKEENKDLKEHLAITVKETLDIKAIRRLAADLGYYVAKRPVRKEASKDE